MNCVTGNGDEDAVEFDPIADELAKSVLELDEDVAPLLLRLARATTGTTFDLELMPGQPSDPFQHVSASVL